MTTAKPMSPTSRRDIYLRGRADMTPAQRRRLRKKDNRALRETT